MRESQLCLYRCVQFFLALAILHSSVKLAHADMTQTLQPVTVVYSSVIALENDAALHPKGVGIAFALGYKHPGDGGGGQFFFNPSDARKSNGGTVLSVRGIEGARWNRLYSGARYVTYFGATGDGKTDDTAAIQAAVDDTPDGGQLVFPLGTYVVSGIRVSRPIKLLGEGVSKWDSHGAELIAKGDQSFVLAFTHESETVPGVALGGEVSNLALEGGGHQLSEGVFVGLGFSEVTIRNLEIGHAIGNGVRLQHWFEGKFENVFFNSIDASHSDAVFFVGPIALKNLAANVNNLRIYASRFESNFGTYIKSDPKANMDIFVLSNCKFEWSGQTWHAAERFPLFDLDSAFRVQIFSNSITQFRFGRNYSTILKVAAGSGSPVSSRGAGIKFFNNDFSGLDNETVLLDSRSDAAVQWSSNTIIDSSFSKKIAPEAPQKNISMDGFLKYNHF
ncbi:glycosyl hydrolase family 28-related protein [Paraburkholderia fungorum]|uniref:glycosyl hydrolase family 28-related protein n=1 Tax=Paraburkholderia fungorum TaxID=134537 RepID=UPI0038BC23EC